MHGIDEAQVAAKNPNTGGSVRRIRTKLDSGDGSVLCAKSGGLSVTGSPTDANLGSSFSKTVVVLFICLFCLGFGCIGSLFILGENIDVLFVMTFGGLVCRSGDKTAGQ